MQGAGGGKRLELSRWGPGAPTIPGSSPTAGIPTRDPLPDPTPKARRSRHRLGSGGGASTLAASGDQEARLVLPPDGVGQCPPQAGGLLWNLIPLYQCPHHHTLPSPVPWFGDRNAYLQAIQALAYHTGLEESGPLTLTSWHLLSRFTPSWPSTSFTTPSGP